MAHARFLISHCRWVFVHFSPWAWTEDTLSCYFIGLTEDFFFPLTAWILQSCRALALSVAPKVPSFLQPQVDTSWPYREINFYLVCSRFNHYCINSKAYAFGLRRSLNSYPSEFVSILAMCYYSVVIIKEAFRLSGGLWGLSPWHP